VAVVYFDASALVKLVVDEDGSELAATLWDRCDAAVASRLAYAEVCAALAASRRNHDLTTRHLDQALAAFDRYWAAVRPVELTEEVQRDAGRLARTHALSGADAVHLASSLVIGDPTLVVATWDRRLAAGALTCALAVSPANA
jgi:predicted nucleic acid-binding protein